MSSWEDDYALGIRMPSDNKTKYGAVRYVTIGGYDRQNQEQLAEAEQIIALIADAPDMLKALEGCVLAWQREAALYHMMNNEEKQEPAHIARARALIAKHRGGV